MRRWFDSKAIFQETFMDQLCLSTYTKHYITMCTLAANHRCASDLFDRSGNGVTFFSNVAPRGPWQSVVTVAQRFLECSQTVCCCCCTIQWCDD